MRKWFSHGWAFGLLLTAFAATAEAQNAAEHFIKGTDYLNSLDEYIEGLDSLNINNRQLQIATELADLSVASFDKAIAMGNPQYTRLARYYKTEVRYKMAQVYDLKGEKYVAFERYVQIFDPIIHARPIDFPVVYTARDKAVSVSWDDYKKTQLAFYRYVTALGFKLEKYDETLKLALIGIEDLALSDYDKYLETNRLLDFYAKTKDVANDENFYKYALQSMGLFLKLNPDYKQKAVTDKNVDTWTKGYNSVAAVFTQQKSRTVGILNKYLEIAEFLRVLGETDRSAPFYVEAIANGVGTKVDWLNGLSVAKTMKNNALGILCLDKLLPLTAASDCDKMKQIGDDYAFFGDTNKARMPLAHAERCYNFRKQQDALTADQRNKDARKGNKAAYAATNPRNVFIGFDVLPLAFDRPKADIGGHIDLRDRKLAHSFGYINARANVDKASDNHTWNGFTASYGLKSFIGKYFYTGFQLNYTRKSFDTLTATVAPRSKPTATRTQILSPQDAQTGLFWQSGVQFLSGWFSGVDVHFALGGSYNVLTYKEIDIKSTIIENSSFAAQRSAPESWRLAWQIGISTGLNIGRRR